jgi:hypothetical protein
MIANNAFSKKENKMTKSLIEKASYQIKAGNVAAAEELLVSIADNQGDRALQIILNEVPPRDLLAIMRNYDSSNESVINLLVSPEQFANAVVNETLYRDHSNSKLRGMINAIFFRDDSEVTNFLDALNKVDGAVEVLINYLADHMEDVCYFSRFGTFNRHSNFEENPNAWILDENYNWYESKPIDEGLPLIEVSDHSWKEITWLLLNHYPDLFNQVIPQLRTKVLTELTWESRQKANDYEDESISKDVALHSRVEEEPKDDDYDEKNDNAL